jgi:MFS family permease
MTSSFQGPYFYQVYASKTFGSSSSAVVSWVSRLFLTGFASTALFGPLVGRLCDSYGRKAGTLAFSLLYSLGAISTKSNVLGVLLLGRVMGGIGTSLLFSAPEAWLVGEAGKEGVESSLGETFGLVSFVLEYKYRFGIEMCMFDEYSLNAIANATICITKQLHTIYF